MNRDSPTPGRLAVHLTIYFATLVAALALTAYGAPDKLELLPIGGTTVRIGGLPSSDESRTIGEIAESPQQPTPEASPEPTDVFDAALLLVASLAGTVVLMIPVTWVYMATKHAEGYGRRFVEALITLPICATSIVLLIQDSLALAFGLAALVTAVRFRVQLSDALDGIYVFASICVGLASGVGYLGVALIMTMFFCYAAVSLWALEYGKNAIEESARARKLAKARLKSEQP